MKKFMNWMLAAILICGTSVVLTSCSKSDDNDDKGSTTPNTYEVTLTAVLPESAAGLYTLNVEYTDGNGKASTGTVKAGDTSDVMPANMKTLYDSEKAFTIGLVGWDAEKAKMFDQLIVKNFKFTVPAGKSYRYKVTMKARTDYVKPSADAFYFVVPFAYADVVRVSGNQPYSGLQGELKLNGFGPVDAAEISEFIKLYDGKVIAEASRTM
jgi:hypothetical protein